MPNVVNALGPVGRIVTYGVRTYAHVGQLGDTIPSVTYGACVLHVVGVGLEKPTK